MQLDWLVLFVSAGLGGALNSVAGGGSFITFPALVVSGVQPVTANATSTVALWPGSVASVGAYRRELGTLRHVRLLSGTSFIGGLLGALLLLRTPNDIFSQLIPYLLLVATLVFAFNEQLKRRLRGLAKEAADESGRFPYMLVTGQLIIAIYGGFFGGGIGILMLAALGLFGMENIHEMNALKTLLASCINGIAVITFIVARAVDWPHALIMIAGAAAGGYLGASGARRVDPVQVRRFVVVVGVLMTLYFFIRR